MSKLEDILYNGLLLPEDRTYDLELYLSTIIDKYVSFLKIIQTNPLDKIKNFIEVYSNIVDLHRFHLKNGILPICYIFMNENLSETMIDYFIDLNFKLNYDNEKKLITFYLLNNECISIDKKIELIKYLKDKNFNFFNKDQDNNNIFHYLSTVKNLNNDLYEVIFTYCMEINELNYYSETPLLLATNENNEEYTKFLISKGADVNLINRNYNSCLMYSCMNSNLEISKLLILNGAEINCYDMQKDTPLFYACGCDNRTNLNLDLIKFLISKNAKFNTISEEGFSVLHYASGCTNKRPDFEVLKYLINIKVDIDLIDIDNNFFTDYLFEHASIYKVLNFLKELNLSIKLKNSLILKFDKDLWKISSLKLFTYYDFIELESICNLCVNEEICNKCMICHDSFENKIVKCKNNHYFDNECIIKWFTESKKNVCPLCFDIINLSEIYFI